MKTLSELDWNFDNVPDNELVACCYWEYARESARIRAAFDQDDKVFFPNPTPNYVVSPRGVRMKTSSVINTARARFVDEIREKSLPLLVIVHHTIDEVAALFDVPWQELSAVVRQAVIAELAPYFADKPGLTFLPFNRCSEKGSVLTIDTKEGFWQYSALCHASFDWNMKGRSTT